MSVLHGGVLGGAQFEYPQRVKIDAGGEAGKIARVQSAVLQRGAGNEMVWALGLQKSEQSTSPHQGCRGIFGDDEVVLDRV